MSFDKDTRNALANMVVQCRRLLIRDVTEQLQETFGIQPDGTALPLAYLTHLNEDQTAHAHELRELIAHYAATASGSTEEGRQSAYDRTVLEISFTIVNRLAALRLCEERDLLHECIRCGMASEGFQLFDRLANGALGSRFETYKLFLSHLFDDLSVDLGVLFDRSSPQSLVFPREKCLEDILALLNQDGLKNVWVEDETIGWIYQYFNPSEERKAMREKSPAPRNSRELAVRNQFFTPRYVVEFLTDNTLGRIWYEMNRGETRLKDQCRYLVRRPKEVFLQAGEPVPEQPQQDNLSQEELLKQPAYVPDRPIKDPREILMLDPACGSMHFGLYAFDLFEVIYDEAWEIAHGSDEALKSSIPFAPFVSFVTRFSDKATFLAEVPRLIVEHNIRGIDIDPRCVQISGLSLWLRAQRAWQKLGLRSQDRPRISRSNVVCAEPMPGEEGLLDEFINTRLSATPEEKVLGQLVRRVFDAMKLAGEAGSLLKVEGEIAGAVAEAKQKWLAAPRAEQVRLFADDIRPVQKGLSYDVAGVTDETFWEKAEERIYTALQAYAEQAEQDGYQRRLFAEDAARGFAFIDLCRKRYDIVLMNPPFGGLTPTSKRYLSKAFPDTWNDVYACFIERTLQLLHKSGRLGCITSSTYFNLVSFRALREKLLKLTHPQLLADLGSGVMDDAAVSAAAAVIENTKESGPPIMTFLDLRHSFENERNLRAFVGLVNDNSISSRIYVRMSGFFQSLPNYIFAYWTTHRVHEAFLQNDLLGDIAENSFGLHARGSDDQVYRAWWEVRNEPHFLSEWPSVKLGGDPNRFVRNSEYVVNWNRNGALLREIANHAQGGCLTGIERYFEEGLTYIYTGNTFSVQPLEKQAIFTAAAHGLFPKQGSYLALLAFLNSEVCRLFLKTINPDRFFQAGYVRLLPIPKMPEDLEKALEEIGSECVNTKMVYLSGDECCRWFCVEWTSSPENRSIHSSLLEKFGEAYLARIEHYTATIAKLNQICLKAYGLQPEDIGAIAERTVAASPPSLGSDLGSPSQNARLFISSAVSYWLGVAFGRWDVRCATLDKPIPELPEPFGPLPACPPGQLQNEMGSPLTSYDVQRLKNEGRWNYPIEIPWDGIMVEDQGNQLDIDFRIRETLQIIWKDRWESIEREACEILGVTRLREYFQKPAGFFGDHLKRYSKSRRQAPIYWPISTASGSYTIWLYYHRLSEDTLYTVINRYVEPKMALIERDIARFESELASAGGRDVFKLREKIEKANDFLDELREFREELLCIAALPYKPNLNDGVIINAAPFHRLFRLRSWAKDTEEVWHKLEKGEYDWAHLAYTIWPDRVKEVCKRDRSIAIAHGLEESCENPVKAARSKAKKVQVAYSEEPAFPYSKVAENRSQAGNAKERILAVLRGAVDPLSKAQILVASGIANSGWSAMQALKNEGLVEQIGKKGNTVYKIKGKR